MKRSDCLDELVSPYNRTGNIKEAEAAGAKAKVLIWGGKIAKEWVDRDLRARWQNQGSGFNFNSSLSNDLWKRRSCRRQPASAGASFWLRNESQLSEIFGQFKIRRHEVLAASPANNRRRRNV